MNSEAKLARIMSVLDNLTRRLDRAEAQSRADDAEVLERKQRRLAVLERDQLAKVTQAVVDFRERADAVLAPYGDIRTPSPVLGEDSEGYKKRILVQLQNRLPPTHELYRLAIGDIRDDALEVFSEQILSAAKASAFDPTTVPRGPLAKRELTDPYTGQKSTAFLGQESFIKDFSMPPRKLKRLINPKNGQVLIGPDSPTVKILN